VNLDRLASRQRGGEVIQRCGAGIRAAALCEFVGDDGVTLQPTPPALQVERTSCARRSNSSFCLTSTMTALSLKNVLLS